MRLYRLGKNYLQQKNKKYLIKNFSYCFNNFNKVVLVGRLTRDVELRHTGSGTAVAEISLAVNNRRRNQQGEWEDEASFFDVTLWDRDA